MPSLIPDSGTLRSALFRNMLRAMRNGFVASPFYFVRLATQHARQNFPVIGSTSRFGALHSNLLDELEQTVESLARDRHLIEYAKIKFVLRARRFVTESIFLFTVGHPAFGGAQAVR